MGEAGVLGEHRQPAEGHGQTYHTMLHRVHLASGNRHWLYSFKLVRRLLTFHILISPLKPLSQMK